MATLGATAEVTIIKGTATDGLTTMVKETPRLAFYAAVLIYGR
jgi:hypothetical protein